MDCKLEFLYYVTREKAEYIPLHKHECYELVYYVNGSGSSGIDGKSDNYLSGSFAIVEPGCLHDENHNTKTEVLFIGFQFKGEGISLKNGIYSDDHRHSVFDYLAKIKEELSDQKKYFRLKLDLLLKELLIELERIKPAASLKTGNFSYIKKFLEENCHQKIDLKVLADLSGYSYHRFRHLFKQKTGFSPVSYILNCRISMAKKLLATDMSVSEISQSCGFYSESQFSSLFKRETGISPSCFRKKADYNFTE